MIGVGDPRHLGVEGDRALIHQIEQVGLILHQRVVDDLLVVLALHRERAEPVREIRGGVLLKE